METKKWILVLLSGLCVGVLLILGGEHLSSRSVYPTSAKVSLDAPCVSGPTVQCPSPEFLKDFDHLQDINNLVHEIQSAPISEISKLKPVQPAGIQDYLDLSTGISMRLRQQIPPGFQWDQDKKEFVRMAPAAPQPVPPAPVPAKPAPKK